MFERFKKLDFGLRKTRDAWFNNVRDVFDRAAIDQELWDQLEELLIGADVGVETTDELLAFLRERVATEGIRDARQVGVALKQEIVTALTPAVDEEDRPTNPEPGMPRIVLVIGVNGVGKTTSVAKLANLMKADGQNVLIAAADTFRAGAIEQLMVWGRRLGVDVVAHQPGADSGAVVFDAVQAAGSRSADVLLVDTAGRLHTKDYLMEELGKIDRVIKRVDPTAPHEVLLTMDATTGQNGLLQAEKFYVQAGTTGIILTKLDGTSRGGVTIAISQALGIPISYIGAGEGIDDLSEFDAGAFVEALFERAVG